MLVLCLVSGCAAAAPKVVLDTRHVVHTVLDSVKDSDDVSRVKQATIDAACQKVSRASLEQTAKIGGFDGIDVIASPVPAGVNYFFTKSLDLIGSNRAVLVLFIGRSGDCSGSISWSGP